jgi:putative ABC transport system permease protein
MRLLIDSAKMAIASLLSKKARSFLSMLGIVIGILTVSSLLSIALTVRNEIEGSINNLGTNLITVVPGDISSGNFASSLGASTLTEADYLDLHTDIDTIKDVSALMLVSGTVKSGDKSLPQAIIFGASAHADKNLNIKTQTGSFISEENDQAKDKVVVLGDKAALELFGTREALGKKVELRSSEFEVIGILEHSSTETSFGGPDINSVVILPLNSGWELTNTRQIYRIMMQAKKADETTDAKKQVEDLLLENHKKEKDFSVLTQEDLLKQVNGILNIITAMLSAIASISLLVGGIGIMNIMFVSVSERTREIGIRKAVGATQGAILLQFLIESAILTLLAGIIAVGLFSLVVSLIPKDSPIPISLDPQVLLLALGFSAVVGIIFGIIPAIGASRKNPIDALRYE